MLCVLIRIASSIRGDSNKYTKPTIFNISKKITQNYHKSAAMGVFETAEVLEPSVFEPLNSTLY